ncbi:MAG: ABC transporter ATP-binding protein [Leptospiraceae bacterium]|nr:ABC transporter ATP-binding protein [Leptospiraceae bacterium]
MEIKKLPSQNESFSYEIIQKISEILGIQFDTIQALSDLEIFRRKNSDSIDNNSFEEIVFLGKKYGINFILQESSFESIIDTITSSTPASVYSKKLGWVVLTASIGPFVRVVSLSDPHPKWLLKAKVKKLIQQDVDNKRNPLWILVDNGFIGFSNKHHSHSSYMNSIIDFIQLEKQDIWAIAIYSVAIGILSLVIPIGVQSLVNILNFGTLFQPILVLTFLVIIALSFVGLMNLVQSYIAELIQQRLFVRLAAKVTDLLPRTKHSEMQKVYGSEVSNYFLDISIIQKSATVLLKDGLGIFLQTIIGLLVLVLYHPIFIVFNILIMAVVIGIIFYLIGPIGIETSVKESKSKHKLASWLAEMNYHKTVFRSEKSHRYANFRSEHLTREYIKYRKKHFNALLKQMIGFVSLQAFGSGLLLGIGGWLVIKGQITLGQLIASEIIVAKILDNFGKFSKYLESFYDLCASIDKINHLLEFSEEYSGREHISFPKDIPIEVKIENLRMQVGELHFSDLNFTAEKGQIVVIHDESKKNSSLLLDVLFGFYSTSHGAIEVNNYHLQDISVSQWRDHVDLLRDLEVFSGSIADNVKLSKLDSDSSEIRNVLEEVGLLGRIQEFPSGVHSEIYRNGYPFSKEDLALLVFARAFLTKPGILLVDGLLNYLSHESLSKILNLFREYKKYSTIIISSTLPEVQKISDKVYTVKKGKFLEKGKA